MRSRKAAAEAAKRSAVLETKLLLRDVRPLLTFHSLALSAQRHSCIMPPFNAGVCTMTDSALRLRAQREAQLFCTRNRVPGELAGHGHCQWQGLLQSQSLSDAPKPGLNRRS